MKDEQQKDFPEFDGIPVKVTLGGITGNCKVALCDYDVGITVVADEQIVDTEKGDNVICVNGPSADHKKCNFANYDEGFYIIVDMIKAGHITLEGLISIPTRNKRNQYTPTTLATCAITGL